MFLFTVQHNFEAYLMKNCLVVYQNIITPLEEYLEKHFSLHYVHVRSGNRCEVKLG